jgi:hypothetical protein
MSHLPVFRHWVPSWRPRIRSSRRPQPSRTARILRQLRNYLLITCDLLCGGRVLRFGVRQCGRWHTRLFVSVAVRHDAEVEINAGLTSGQLPHFKTIVGFGSTRCKESSARALCRWKAHGLLVSADADIVRSGLRKQCTVSELKVNYR